VLKATHGSLERAEATLTPRDIEALRINGDLRLDAKSRGGCAASEALSTHASRRATT
jgi:hypothetical protein